MHNPISFYVSDTPKPGGSKKAFIINRRDKKTGAVYQAANIVEDCNATAGWRNSVIVAATKAYRGPLLTGALKVLFVFYQSRPKGHYGEGRNSAKVKASSPKYPGVKPDVLKLARSTEDALTGHIWKDDASTVDLHLIKKYCEPGQRPGVQILIAPMK